MLLDHLGHPTAAQAVEAAVLADRAAHAVTGAATPRSTSEVGDAIAARVAGGTAPGT
jgi:3-isopropylmalate dehydrogenase